jgi:hypothetical protein
MRHNGILERVGVLVMAILPFPLALRAAPATQPATAFSDAASLAQASRVQLENQIRAFRQAHPGLDTDGKLQQELAEVAKQYTQSQLATIEARATYRDDHPVLVRARQNEEVTYARYQVKLRQVMDINAAAAEYQQLENKVEQLRAREREFFHGEAPATQPASRQSS